tara:strand:+ start:1024 stop:1206 length:183 start_codon:yes stop_codon:yes gene_type:complete
MNGKFDTTNRSRKTSKNGSSKAKSGGYITSHNIRNEKDVEKWMKANNSKRGGTSRHREKM